MNTLFSPLTFIGSGSRVAHRNPNFKIVLFLLVLTGLFGFLDPASAVNKRKEIKIGEQANKGIIKQYGLLKDEDVQNYVTDVGNRLVDNLDDPQFQYHFQVLDHSIINAFALPGGYVYVTRGMLAYLNSEAQLAVILGHEIGHITSHHAMKQMKKNLGATILSLGALAASSELRKNAGDWLALSTSLSHYALSGYGRKNELESDRLGMLYAYESGYDPSQGIKFFDTLRFMRDISGVVYHGFLASHPDTVDRIIQAEDISSILVNRGGHMEIQSEAYLKHVNGILFGEKNLRRGLLPKHRIEVYEVKDGDNFRSVANRVMKNDTLALDVANLNGMRVDDGLEKGQKIKILTKVNQNKKESK